MKKVIRILLVMMAVTMLSAAPASAAIRYIKDTTKSVTVEKGKKITIRQKNAKCTFTAKTGKLYDITKTGVLKGKVIGKTVLKFKVNGKTRQLTVKVVKSDPMVWKTATGKKYHKTNHCGSTNTKTATRIHLSEAVELKLTKCANCW